MTEARHKDVILIPAYNRRETTLSCLRTLAADSVMDWADVLLIDDGSTDGTGEAALAAAPGIQILHGDGGWWWGGAIRRGMEWALARGAERIIWLNDDCRPERGALRALSEEVTRDGAIIWLSAQDPSGASFGGYRKGLFSFKRCSPADDERGMAECFNGNCVCLPRAWIEKAGLPHDHLFPHALCDFDYGLRLNRLGAPMRALAGRRATSETAPSFNTESWLRSRRAMLDIWRGFSSPRSYVYFPAWRRFALRHWGPIWGWFVFIAPYLRWLLIALFRPFLRLLTKPNTRTH